MSLFAPFVPFCSSQMNGSALSHPFFMLDPEFMRHPSLCVLCSAIAQNRAI